jgi:M6 family metalloprotease-like protein
MQRAVRGTTEEEGLMRHFSRCSIALAFLLLLPVIIAAQGHIYTKAAPSGPRWTTTSTSWVDIKDLELWFYQYDAGNACIGFTSESGVTTGARMFVRALVDGETASPSDVVYASEAAFYCRMFQFAANLGEGIHHVKLQVKVDAGGTAQFGDRTLLVTAAPTLVNIVAAPSGALLTTTSGSWSDVADMTLNLNLPSAGPLVLTFGAEVLNTAGAATFLRVLVDGVAPSPSDVMIADEYLLGVHSMSFVSPTLSTGSHTAKVQWCLSGSGTAYLGDRTLSIASSNLVALANTGGIASVSAPSGPAVSTTSSGFEDIPGLTLDLSVPENSTLAITVQGEAQVSGSRMFVRATVDGVTCSPSDATQTRDSGYRGTTSMAFVMKNVARGTRHIAAQWLIDAGETAYFGDRNVTVLAFPTAGPDITSGFQELQPAVGTGSLLVLMWDPQRPTDPAPTVGAVTNLIYGSYPSVSDYFTTNSGNNFAIANAGILGWFAADKPYSFYWSAEDPTDADHDGFTSGHVRKWWEAITKADATFDFSIYDTNGDGVLDPRELGIVIVIPQNSAFGTVRVPASQQYPAWQPLVVDGVTIPLIAEVYAGSPPNMGAFVHETSHLLFNLPDMYFAFYNPYDAGAYSIMDACYWDAHLDPFHKIHLGWLQPTIVRHSGWYTIYPVESAGEAYVLMDPAHGEKEYFIVENRGRSQHYDTMLPDSGLAVWHVMEDPAVYGALAAPTGVSSSDWSTIATNDWGRRAIRLIRPVYGPPLDNARSLWDGADPTTGYDLLSSDPNNAHAQLRWHDGTPSGFAIRQISAASAVMDAYFEIPATATGVAGAPSFPSSFILHQNYPNPFNPSTVVSYQLPLPCDIRLIVYDVLGREVAVLVDERKEAGNYTVVWDAHNIASGIYFCSLTAGSFRDVKKMALVR